MTSAACDIADAPPEWPAERTELLARIAQLEQQLAWFQRQIFGEKSERRLLLPPPGQLSLGEGFTTPGAAPASDTPVSAHRRRTSRDTPEKEDEDEEALFFDSARVPVEVIAVPNPATDGLAPEDYEVIGEKVSYRLAQRPGSYVILKYVRPLIKRKDDQRLHCPPAPAGVLEGGRADVSFLAGLVIDKFLYHLPLYRQHQRLSAAGIEVSRAWLTQQVLAAALLLTPIVAAQLSGIRAARVKAMDETPIKAGRQGPGKLKKGYFWPIWGDTDEGGGGDIVFLYRPSRAARHVREGLGEHRVAGEVLISDGYSAYARYAERVGLTHAQCWAHTRRTFERAKEIEPAAVAEALDLIGAFYACERAIRKQGLRGEAKRDYRLTHAKPVVEGFFAWAEEQVERAALLPSNPLTKALHYALQRREALSVYLDDPDVPIDTNHLERALRPIPMGRKNWLFCWTEVGAEAVATLQSLIVTCQLHDIDPYVYLVDVLQRIDQHPAAEVHRLIPRLWKQQFAENLLRSDLSRSVPATQ
ncbi:transposase (plasmid) [Thioflavicoccus mobilis 8321]|uniref:Transposase n=1 Tax=Thioflavicoccus mobilis 8321 TaxID=765912 RepID=L0H2T8_9GAMM|nr:transposase [Thioflavicoccus mobilis 8321]AGA92371.1 transposase [Thioflavicoccus mobilis 8321]AGA92382.1 transposase [Thioflavicoccus mobilis 8321]AGA92423.1 transposase [Thioflavicoccus mobilis 8321]